MVHDAWIVTHLVYNLLARLAGIIMNTNVTGKCLSKKYISEINNII